METPLMHVTLSPLGALGRLAAVAALLLGSAAAAQHAPGAPPVDSGLAAEPAVLDLGDVFEGEPARGQIVFRNTTAEPWPVSAVSTTCGCTVATVRGPDGAPLPLRPTRAGAALVELQPGEAITIDVDVTTTNVRGELAKDLHVSHLDPAHPQATVPVRARVTRGIQITPQQVMLGKVGKNQPVEHTLVLQSLAIGDWSITGFAPALEVSPLPPGLRLEALDHEGNERRVKLTIDPGRPIGNYVARVRVLIDHPRIEHVEFFLTGTVEPDVRFDSGHPTLPETINLDKMKPGEVVTRTISITNSDPSVPYRLSSVEVQTKADIEPHFQAVIRTIEDGVSYAVDLTCDGKVLEDVPDASFVRGTLLLRAEHPDLPTHSIVFHGWFQRG